MKTRFTVEVLALAGVAAGLAVTTGCRTVHSDNADLSLAPMPASLSPEPAGNVTYPTPAAEKPQPYYIAHPQEVAALDKAPVAHAAPSRVAGQSYSTYTVKAGDSLSKIAVANGFRTADVLAVNPGLNANKIRVGQTIVLPGAAKAKAAVQKTSAKAPAAASAAEGSYVVQKGDILGRIANKFGVKVADLKKANGLASDKIVVGQKLVIPGAKAPQPKVQPAKAVKPAATPKAEEKKPAAPEVKPVSAPEVPAPVVEVPAPAVDVAAPAVEVPAPAVEAPAPAVEVPAPAVEAVAPAVDVAAPAAEPAKPKGTPHVVQQGQDLFDISVQWGVSSSAIKAFNNMTSDVVVPGQTIMIPPAGSN